VEDMTILDLYWKRDEDAISQTEKKYGRYCHSIAYNILFSDEDAEECVNDTYLKVWNSIPPERPRIFKSFIGRITRNLALDRYDYNTAEKRGGTSVILSELDECIPDTSEDSADDLALSAAINSFLASLSQRTRTVFMQRYFYACSVKQISESVGMTEVNVKVTLLRTRAKLRAHLEKEGISI